MRAVILGIPIDTLTRTEARMRVEQMMNERKQHLVATPNPEMLVETLRDERLASVLKESDLNLPDGVGLLIAARLTGQKILERIPGADFAEDICQIAAEKGKKVYLLGGLKEGVATEAADVLRHKYGDLNIVGSEWGGKLTEIANKMTISEDVIKRINDSKAEILLVGFGHRRQELWLKDNMPLMPQVQLGIGVGGTLDFISGRVKRAPRLFRGLGLEWLWRLIIQPWRWKRIWTAVVVFPLLVLKNRRRDINQ